MPVLFSVCGWASTDAGGWLCALSYAVLCSGLEHPWVLVSAGVPKPVPCGYWGATGVMKFWGSWVILGFSSCVWGCQHPRCPCSGVNCSPKSTVATTWVMWIFSFIRYADTFWEWLYRFTFLQAVNKSSYFFISSSQFLVLSDFYIFPLQSYE